MPSRRRGHRARGRVPVRPQPATVAPATGNLLGSFASAWSTGGSNSFMDDIRNRIRDAFSVNFGERPVNVITYGPDDSDTSGSAVDPPTPAVAPKPEPIPVIRPEPVAVEKPALTVKVVNVKITANGAAHRTNRYEISSPLEKSPKLVVRRGQPFNIDIEFSRVYDPKEDDLRIRFEAGPKPLASKGTSVEFILSDEDKPKEWGAKIVSVDANIVSIDIFTPPNCFVGKWVFKIDVIKKDNTSINVYRYQHPEPFYIIFNPWCEDDTVYMPDEALLKEYVLNETGKIYTGNKTSIREKPWNFGQFESCVLDVALFILDLTEMSWAVRGNPITVIRKISATVNAPDDGGILAGNWSGDYTGGTSPLSWTGSVPILEEFWASKTPVRFGQCWVFCGVCTTISRALGIPARCITNFESAHDTDGSITIDVHFKADGELDDFANDDSVW